MGSANGPAIWGRVVSVLARVTQAVLWKYPALLQVYVDDPIWTICADEGCTQRIIAIIILLW
eukprot:4863779-Amphidinium_carterae.1